MDIREVEWQFDAVGLRPVVRWLTGGIVTGAEAVPSVEIAPGRTVSQSDVYLDSDDWRFARAGYTLRVRRVGRRRAEATLKELEPIGTSERRAGARNRRELTEELVSPDPEILARAQGPVGTRIRWV